MESMKVCHRIRIQVKDTLAVGASTGPCKILLTVVGQGERRVCGSQFPAFDAMTMSGCK